MKTTTRLAKNSLALLMASVVERVLNVVLVAYLVRSVSQESFGIYTVVITFFELGSILADLGMRQLLIREIAQRRDKASAIWSNALLLGVLWAVIGWLGVGLIGSALGYSTPVLQLLWVVGGALLFKVMWMVTGAVLRAFERMEIVAVASCGFSLLLTLASIACLQAGLGVPELIWILASVTALTGLVLFVIVHRRFVPFIPQIDCALWAWIMQEVWPIAVLLGCNVFLRRAGILILSQVQSITAVATYGAAVKAVDYLSLLTGSLTGALLPHLAIKWSTGIQAGWRVYKRSLRFFITLSAGLTAGALILAQPLLLLILGPSYAESVTPLQILLLTFFLNFIGGPMGTLLLVSKNQLIAFIPRALAVTALNVGLSLWLLPDYGYLAASWIAVISSVGFLLQKTLIIQRLTGQPTAWPALLARPMVSAAGMAILLYFLRDWPLLLTVPLGAASYGGLLVLFGEFRHPDYAFLWQSWQSIRQVFASRQSTGRQGSTGGHPTNHRSKR